MRLIDTIRRIGFNPKSLIFCHWYIWFHLEIFSWLKKKKRTKIHSVFPPFSDHVTKRKEAINPITKDKALFFLLFSNPDKCCQSKFRARGFLLAKWTPGKESSWSSHPLVSCLITVQTCMLGNCSFFGTFSARFQLLTTKVYKQWKFQLVDISVPKLSPRTDTNIYPELWQSFPCQCHP